MVVSDVAEGELQDEDPPGAREELGDDPQVGLGSAADLLDESADGRRDDEADDDLPVPGSAPTDDPHAGTTGADDREKEQEGVVDGLEMVHENSRG